MSWYNSVFNSGYTLNNYPRPIAPTRPDYLKCNQRYGRELVKGDCKAAVLTMPWARAGAEVDWVISLNSSSHAGVKA